MPKLIENIGREWWERYTEARKWQIAHKEANMETHNATTKEDMINMIRFLVDCVDPNLREEFDFENRQVYPSNRGKP